MTSKRADPTATEDAERVLERQAIERLDAGQPPASPEEAAARAPYERLVNRLREVDEECEPPAGWEARAVARWRGVRRRAYWRGGMVAAVAGLGIAAVLLLRCTERGAGGEPVAVLLVNEAGQVRRGASDAVIGDRLQVRVGNADEAAARSVKVLVYLGGRRVAGCPGEQGCRREGSELLLERPLLEAGSYTLAVIRSERAWSSDLEGSLEADVLAARRAGASVELRELRVIR